MDQIEDLAKTLTHDELLEVTESTLCTLLSSDTLLSDLPSDVILEEVISQIAVEHGQAITVFIARDEAPLLKVIIPQTSSVRDLKNAIARHFEIHQKRNGSKVKISWKYIWKTYHLHFDGIVLDNNSSCIDEYGIRNKVKLAFKKKYNKKKT